MKIIGTRSGLKALGLCALLLGLMALATPAAQAEPHWNVNGSAISSTLLPEAKGTLENKEGSLLSKVLGATFRTLCTGEEFEILRMLAGGRTIGRFRWTGCEVYINGVLSAACLPRDGIENDVVLSRLLRDLIVLGPSKEPLDSLEPEEGTTLANIETGEECSVGAKIPVIGKFVVKDCQGEGAVEKVTHLVEEGPGTEMWIISKTVEHKAVIDGSSNVFLRGAHEGLKWSATPE